MFQCWATAVLSSIGSLMLTWRAPQDPKQFQVSAEFRGHFQILFGTPRLWLLGESFLTQGKRIQPGGHHVRQVGCDGYERVEKVMMFDAFDAVSNLNFRLLRNDWECLRVADEDWWTDYGIWYFLLRVVSVHWLNYAIHSRESNLEIKMIQRPARRYKERWILSWVI